MWLDNIKELKKYADTVVSYGPGQLNSIKEFILSAIAKDKSTSIFTDEGTPSTICLNCLSILFIC